MTLTEHKHGNDFRTFLKKGHFLYSAPHLLSLTLALYRYLGDGVPLQRTILATYLGVSETQLNALLNDIPGSTLDFDETGAIIAFGGLSITPANHKFKIGDKQLYTWCVFDALFLPQLLDKSATLSTSCPLSGKTIEIDLTPDAIISSRPSQPVMSIITPDSSACCQNLRGAFCNHINLFANKNTFSDWANERTDAAYVSLEEAHDLAHQRNRYCYGDLLHTP